MENPNILRTFAASIAEWRWLGSDMGTLVGMAGGAAVGAAIGQAADRREAARYDYDRYYGGY